MVISEYTADFASVSRAFEVCDRENLSIHASCSAASCRELPHNVSFWCWPTS